MIYIPQNKRDEQTIIDANGGRVYDVIDIRQVNARTERDIENDIAADTVLREAADKRIADNTALLDDFRAQRAVIEAAEAAQASVEEPVAPVEEPVDAPTDTPVDAAPLQDEAGVNIK